MSANETMKIDLHCHTEASYDCITPFIDIPARCVQKGIQVQAITDHNEIWAAKALKSLVESDPEIDLTVIVGEEISTTEGEIIGLFLQEVVPPGLSPDETVRLIKEQNGLALLPHGFDPLKVHRLRPEARDRLASDFDIVETFNARVSRPIWNETAEKWAQENQKLMSAGSDAHRLKDIGDAWAEASERPILNPADLLDALLTANPPQGIWTHPVWAFAKKTWEQLGARWEQR
jgi:predicted metal-dependent phosphoesterase TrpH